jgi:hypothetical protein
MDGPGRIRHNISHRLRMVRHPQPKVTARKDADDGRNAC